MLENTIEIRRPIWASRSVGIAEHKMTPTFKVKITYGDCSGNLLYPNTYRFTRAKAMTYPQQMLKAGVVVRVIPIADLEIVEDES